MEKKLQQFENKAFVWQKKTYIVKQVLIKNLRAIIVTDRRTFVWYESQLDDFMKEIVFLENKPELPAKNQSMVPVLGQDVIECEIIEQNGLAARLTEKLEGMFDMVEADPSDETLKKAKSMVDLANTIVNVQNTNYKFLMLRR